MKPLPCYLSNTLLSLSEDFCPYDYPEDRLHRKRGLAKEKLQIQESYYPKGFVTLVYEVLTERHWD